MPSKDKERRKQATWEWRQRRLAKMRKYLGGKCVICGCLDNLEFHHKDPTQKSFNFAQKWARWSVIQPELDKCELRCHTHHMAFHEARHGTISRYLSKYHLCRCDQCVAAFREYDRLKHARYRREKIDAD